MNLSELKSEYFLTTASIDHLWLEPYILTTKAQNYDLQPVLV